MRTKNTIEKSIESHRFQACWIDVLVDQMAVHTGGFLVA